MTRKLLVLFFLAPIFLLAAEDRKAAIVVLNEPSAVEHFAAEQPTHEHIRSRVYSAAGEQHAAQLRANKASIATAIRQAGAEVTGQTELVLNAVMVQATESQLAAISRIPGVRLAQFARTYHVTLDAAVPLIHGVDAWNSTAIGGEANAGRGVKIAIIDTGIDQTHPMFQDPGLTAPAGFPKGMATYTNSKVIAAYSYITGSCSTDPIDCSGNASDGFGHGTFVSAVAAGLRTQAPQASITGVAPKAFLGNYRAGDSSGNFQDTAIVSAINQAVADGMNIINMSFGPSSPAVLSDLNNDPTATAIANAQAAGLLMVAAAGNIGPGSSGGSAFRSVTTPCVLPSVVCVGATTNAHAFGSIISVSSAVGGTIPASLAQITGIPGNQPIFSAATGPAPLVDVSTVDATGQACSSISASSVGSGLQGAIVLIKRGSCTFYNKVLNAQNAGAAGVIVYNNVAGTVFMDTSGNPQLKILAMSITNSDGVALKALLGGNQVQATLDPTVREVPDTPDVLADFSSRGPGPDLAMKPEVVAPGVNILSATQNTNSNGDMYDPSRFQSDDGTSFSSPMTAGAAALVKQAHPGYSPADVRSALINNASPITSTQDGAVLTNVNAGAGRLNVAAAVSATMTANPAVVTFDNQTQIVTKDSKQIVIANRSSAQDTFTLSIVPRVTSPTASLSLDNSSLSLGANATATVSLNVAYSGQNQLPAEGVINVTSQSTGKTIRVPYWVSPALPALNAGGVVNGANFSAAAGIAPGSIVSVFGIAMSDVAAASALALPLPTQLGGASLTITSRGTIVTAPLFYSSSGQLNVQIPFEILAGATPSAVLTVDGATSNALRLAISQYAPGLFSLTQDGKGPGAILHQDGITGVSTAAPARAGEVIELFGTGLGPVNNSPGTGAPASTVVLANTTTTPTVTIGGQPATVQFSGLAPGYVGLYQINVVVPNGLPAGDQAIQLSIGGVPGNSVTVNVQ